MSLTYEVHVDWDATDWTATPDFSEAIDDITLFVRKIIPDRGKKVELGNIPAGVLDIVLNNSDKRFSPLYASSPLYGKMRPWLPVRVRGTVTGGSAVIIFTGFIARIIVNPHKGIQQAYLYCTDGMDLLARNMVLIDKGDRTMVSDGEAVGLVLDGAGWAVGKRSIDTDTEAIVNYPQTTEY